VSIKRSLHVAKLDFFFFWLPEEKKSTLKRQMVVMKYASDDILLHLKEFLAWCIMAHKKFPLFPAAY